MQFLLVKIIDVGDMNTLLIGANPQVNSSNYQVPFSGLANLIMWVAFLFQTTLLFFVSVHSFFSLFCLRVPSVTNLRTDVSYSSGCRSELVSGSWESFCTFNLSVFSLLGDCNEECQCCTCLCCSVNNYYCGLLLILIRVLSGSYRGSTSIICKLGRKFTYFSVLCISKYM